ncbi:MAG TPA: multifunctional CCA tRNA nucleotidyl transferase/2'3'-cyclic phosphodiesterase/2'nucleotidase/phosphatase, partial [Erwinia persicina]|nr:multifunctional CCA tRNA nucleotidyl transferase/2'3'-cyclic phosphodiesterase/2'nucleotidase/phosphatase [Erwinia persicina]
FENNPYPQGDHLREAWKVVQAVSTKDVVEAGFKGAEVREELTRRRVAALENWKAV